MSKKLIAVASAAALALTAIVGIAPANAAAFSVTMTEFLASGTGESATTAYTITVPESNSVIGESTAATSRAIKVVVSTTTETATVNALATGGLKLLTVTQEADALSTSATGTASLSGAAVSSSFTFYVYSTSTTAATLTVSEGGNTSVKYIVGVAGPAYHISAKFPTYLNSAISSSIDVTVTDVFGNKLTSTTASAFAAGTLTTGVIGAAAVVTSATSYTYNTTRAVWEGKVIGSATPGPAALSVTLSGGGADQTDNGLAAPTLTAFASISNADLAAQVTALTAQVAALTADYNALATRWNKKVDSKRRVFHKVALK